MIGSNLIFYLWNFWCYEKILGFYFATALDLEIGCYHNILDPTKKSTLNLPCGSCMLKQRFKKKYHTCKWAWVLTLKMSMSVNIKNDSR